MDTIPRNDFILRHRYDAFCKAVLRNEAKDYLREMGQQRDREKSLDALTQQELDKLSTVDYYPSDSYVFSSHGYDLLIDNELVAEAFASLPQQEQAFDFVTVFWIWQTEKSEASWECPAAPYSATGQAP